MGARQQRYTFALKTEEMFKILNPRKISLPLQIHGKQSRHLQNLLTNKKRIAPKSSASSSPRSASNLNSATRFPIHTSNVAPSSLGMSTQCSLSSSARSATTRDEDCRPHAKGASSFSFSKFALKLFKLSNFTCNAGTADQADNANAGKKPDAARRKWHFRKPRAADEGSATSQTGDSGELACHRKKKLSIGEEANAVDKKMKETLFDVLLGEREDCAAISKNNAGGSDKITSCTLSQFLASDEHSAGQKRKYGDAEEEEERDCTDIVMVSAGSKTIKSRERNPRTKYHTRRLIRELGRSVPADNTISIYLSKMLCAVGSAGDLFRPIPSTLAELRASLAIAKMRKDLKYVPAPEELWKKEILLGRRCKPLELGASARWSNAKEMPAICHARAGVGDD